LKRGIELTARGDLQSIEGVAVAANLPAHIAQRMTDRAHSLLVDITPAFKLQARRVRSAGPGAGIFATAVYQHSTAGFSNLGELGKPAEEVAEEACSALLQHHQSGAAIDHYLADQCLLPLAMADGNSKFITSHLTSHFHSSAQLIRQLLPQAQISHASSQTGVAVQVVGVGLHPA
jgi:RNA 3'-terminal phosphate cyclase (ATP)